MLSAYILTSFKNFYFSSIISLSDFYFSPDVKSLFWYSPFSFSWTTDYSPSLVVASEINVSLAELFVSFCCEIKFNFLYTVSVKIWSIQPLRWSIYF